MFGLKNSSESCKMLNKTSRVLFSQFKQLRISFLNHRTMQTNGVDYEKYVKFMEVVGNIKHLKRTGWVLRDIKDPETVAAHMYRMSMISFLNPVSNLDRIKCMKMALVHDLAESIVGDITPYCGIEREEKIRREHEAIQKIANLLPQMSSEELLCLYHEYESQISQEAIFVKDCDRYDMIQQAFEYEKRDLSPLKYQEFFNSTKGKFQCEFFINLVNELYRQREKYAETVLQNDCKNNQQSNAVAE